MVVHPFVTNVYDSPMEVLTTPLSFLGVKISCDNIGKISPPLPVAPPPLGSYTHST